MYDCLNIKDAKTIRVVSSPYQYRYHAEFTKDPTRPVRCAGADCPLCNAGYMSNPGWIMMVLNKLDNKLYFMRITWLMFRQLQSLFFEYGDVKTYYIEVKNDNLGPTFLANKPSELTEEQNRLVDSIDHKSLLDMCDFKNHDKKLLEQLTLLI